MDDARRSAPKPGRKMIPQIDRRTLPPALPTPEAMKSWRHNEHLYHPEMWELEYVTYRYLGRMSDTDLDARYEALIRNMATHAAPGREVIPIISYHSCWYWFRRERHTRVEYALRGRTPPPLAELIQPPTPLITTDEVVPDGTKVLFRYSKRKYILDLVQKGLVRFAPAETYLGNENNAARKDDERRKYSFAPGEYTTLKTADGHVMKPIGDMRVTVSGPAYYLACFSCTWNDQLFDDFEADACAVVNNPDEFTSRLEISGKSVFPDWYFHHNPVQYFDPYFRLKDEHLDAATSKDFRLAYQTEYRILWAQINAKPLAGAQFINIGPAQDIIEAYDRAGNRIAA